MSRILEQAACPELQILNPQHFYLKPKYLDNVITMIFLAWRWPGRVIYASVHCLSVGLHQVSGLSNIFCRLHNPTHFISDSGSHDRTTHSLETEQQPITFSSNILNISKHTHLLNKLIPVQNTFAQQQSSHCLS